MFSNKFSISCSSFSPSDTPMIRMLECLKISRRFLSFSSFFWILVSSFCFGWMFLYSFCSKSLIWVMVYFPSLLVLCIFFFISLFIAFTSLSILRPYATISVSMMITSVLNSASDRLPISLLLSSFSRALNCFFHLGHIALSSQFGSLPLFLGIGRAALTLCVRTPVML